ncbi:sensor histidine kinase [Viridibacterium curvum]|uniref:histidine kinase n=1 Tax=Viridibacterium curvum TaxID=1101404 RepID=A0ABP9QQL2_9RHOO
MLKRLIRLRWWLLSGALLCIAGVWLLGRIALTQQREAFETDARIMHRVLSQRVVQHDAILATVSLLQAEQGSEREQRLSALYPQILGMQRRAAGEAWSDARLTAAEARSRELRRPELAYADFAQGRYVLVLAGQPASHAMTVGLREMLPWAEWPTDPKASPVRVLLRHDAQTLVLQEGRYLPWGKGFSFSKHLAADSQPFEVYAERIVGWLQLPWGWMAGWCALVVAGCVAAYQLRTQRAQRLRAEELLRLGQVARLNTLGELAAGMAHELNQPLTAVLANTQAARRLLDDDEPELDTARSAMGKAAEQAQRAAEVVGRLRRVVERPEAGAERVAVDLVQVARQVLYLLEPEAHKRSVAVTLEGDASRVVLAEPVALEQVIHNLVMNALQALEKVPTAQRALTLHISHDNRQGVLRVADCGPGIAPEVLPRLFEPFFSTREDGLGLGLSLCETLAAGMGGELRAANRVPQGAEFTLRLPEAST